VTKTLVSDLVSVFKLRIGIAITLSALGGLAIQPGPVPETWQIVAVALSVLLASSAAGAFNQYAERDLDARMVRTRNRPFVAGRLRPGPLWLLAMGGMLAVALALAFLAANAWSAVYVFAGAFTYGIVYTVWLKRRTWLNIVVGGAAGSFAVLAGAAAVDPALGPRALVLALVLFLWTPPHFWSLALAARDQYAAAGVPMLPVVVGGRRCAQVILAHTVALALLALVPLAFGMGPVCAVFALAGGLWFGIESLRLVLRPERRQAVRNFLASLGQLVLLLAGIGLERLPGAGP
jgi:protoheme IX farnesyltransferase